jgi:hypothetical protein
MVMPLLKQRGTHDIVLPGAALAAGVAPVT